MSKSVECCKQERYMKRPFITSYGVIAYSKDIDELCCTGDFSPKEENGVIVFGKQNATLKILLIKKRNTYAYFSIIRGNWKNTKVLRKLFCLLTLEEQKMVLENNFCTLWQDLWLDVNSPYYKRGYNRAKKRFSIIESNKTSLATITDHSDAMWEFPKGRRNVHEQDICCAFREFEEETTICKDNLMDTKFRSTEIYQGTDKLLYRTDYFLCEIKEPLHVSSPDKISSSLRKTLTEETETYGWFTMSECKKLLNTRRFAHLYNVVFPEIIRIANN